MKTPSRITLAKIAVAAMAITPVAGAASAGDQPMMLAATASKASVAANAKSKPKSKWLSVVTVSRRGGHILDNPDAKTRLVEYASYTCSHCATFESVDAPKLKESEISSGNVNFEMRNLVRDGIDLTISVLARCGAPDKFFARHSYWMKNQSQWLAGNGLITPATEEKAQKDDMAGLMLGVYTDMRLAPHAAKTGITDAQARACFADAQSLNTVIAMTQESGDVYKIPGTPSFLINDIYVDSAHDYASLKTLLLKKNEEMNP
jgi:protein-disulfide isomerase